MKKKRKIISILMCVTILVTLLVPNYKIIQAATKKMSISKTSVTMDYDEEYVISIKNPTQKVKWSSSNKKLATIKTFSSKNSKCKIIAHKKGKVTITAKVGKKKFKCKVKIEYVEDDDYSEEEETPTPKPTIKPTPKPTSTETVTPFPTIKPTATPVVTPEPTVDLSSDYIVAAFGINRLVTSVRFPSTLHIKRIAMNNFQNNQREDCKLVVIDGYAQNGFGGYGEVSARAIKTPSNEDYPGATYYNGYYIFTRASNYSDGSGNTILDNNKAVETYKYLFNGKDIPVD